MKNMKRLASVLLALVMILSMAPALASGDVTGTSATGNGKITIEDAVVGQSYSIYCIFDLKHNATNNAFAYTVNADWAAFIEQEDISGTNGYVNVDNMGYVTWTKKDSAGNEIGAADFAKAALAYAESNDITADSTQTASSTDENKETVELVFDKLPLGYYLVDSSLGTLCGLTTTKPEVTIKEKNAAPSVKKEVQEDSNDSWGETNDADINQVVNFKATITVQAGAENYVLHDTMSAGLTYTGVTSVKIGDATVDAANYTVTSTGLTDGCTFEVAFKDEYIATLDAETEIVVEYSAKLNENAVVGLNGNTNKVKLEYGDENKPSYTPEGPETTTTTYTWDAKIIKYTESTVDGKKTEVMLAGATFKLTTDRTGNNALKFHSLAKEDEDGKVTDANKYEHCADTACTKDHVTEITTDATGTFNIEGLDAGTYYLHETKAPDGYNKLSGPTKIDITGATKGEDNTLTYSTVETKVLNNTGSELPSTGGIGTTIFYVVGGLLMAAAVVLLVTKKKMSVSND